MKKNHVGEIVFGVILIVFAVLFLLDALIFGAIQFFPPVKDMLIHYIVEYVQQYVDSPITEEQINEYMGLFNNGVLYSLIISAAASLLLFILGGYFISLASPRRMAMMNDCFGLEKKGSYRVKFFPVFLILGGVGFVAVPFLANVPELEMYLYIALGASFGFLVLGLLLSIPVLQHTVIKRKYVNNTVTITYPSSRLLVGKFNPSQLINELAAHDRMGYVDLLSYNIDWDKKGHVYVKFTLGAAEGMSRKELMDNKKQFIEEATNALKNKQYLECDYDYYVEEVLSEEYSETRDLTTRYNDYDVVTHYSDGSTTRSSHYTTAVTGSETTFYKDKFYKFTFYWTDPEDGKDYGLIGLDDNNPFLVITDGGRIVIGQHRTGYGS